MRQSSMSPFNSKSRDLGKEMSLRAAYCWKAGNYNQINNRQTSEWKFFPARQEAAASYNNMQQWYFFLLQPILGKFPPLCWLPLAFSTEHGKSAFSYLAFWSWNNIQSNQQLIDLICVGEFKTIWNWEMAFPKLYLKFNSLAVLWSPVDLSFCALFYYSNCNLCMCLPQK